MYLLAAKASCSKVLDEEVENSSLIVSTYRAPALEGVVVYFTCANRLVLTGPNSTTCMSNGEWEPDPKDLKCKGQHVYNRICITIICF